MNLKFKLLKQTTKTNNIKLPEDSIYTDKLGIKNNKFKDILKLTKYLKTQKAIDFYKSIKVNNLNANDNLESEDEVE